MVDYTLAVGTHDPQVVSAENDGDAISRSVGFVVGQYADDMQNFGQEVVTLLGPSGLLTRPSERLDEFVHRIPSVAAAIETDHLQTGDTNTPDCNGD
ncbi:hypothetical protein LGH83_14385 [Lichenihabitans sp. PAMC28606]|uniref:hypothetical protein n=1 Tax=Lichenihabitans sp. PAMC28606 TaxID=2880932 RepID=UPI001D0A6486|nr:hypothetical protein [Lichenihabitans sp. PAMC28606]UDL93741.1 hypothetical protein LGH83_14385 [Lichenihabitans sp. PAMC28606]